ncbi:3'-5' exonuclease, putative [Ricinus communis]|uniref:3'-5' exonuclease, putative n=1 Tax=Ricinus communis TaxID=3988 RepID=B9SQ24_RICCO|nr:3'-5' exonuclease, putative [Ricinus communis]
MTPEITSQTHSPNCRFYTVSFFGSPISVTVTSSASVVRKWLSTTIFHRRYYVGRLVVCVGVQWNPFKSDCLSADTLQLCVGGHCLIFKLSLATRVPRLLRRFLLDTRNTLVGLWNGSDEKMLRNCDHGLLVHRLVDLRRYVENEDGKSLSNASVENIVEECLGHDHGASFYFCLYCFGNVDFGVVMEEGSAILEIYEIFVIVFLPGVTVSRRKKLKDYVAICQEPWHPLTTQTSLGTLFLLFITVSP